MTRYLLIFSTVLIAVALVAGLLVNWAAINRPGGNAWHIAEGFLFWLEKRLAWFNRRVYPTKRNPEPLDAK